MVRTFTFIASVAALLHAAAAQDPDCEGDVCDSDATVAMQLRSNSAARATAMDKVLQGLNVSRGGIFGGIQGVGDSFPFENIDSLAEGMTSGGSCPGPVTASKSLVENVIGRKYTGGSKCLGWWNTKSPSMSELRKLQGSLESYANGEGGGWGSQSGIKWAQGSAADIAEAMYKATYIEGVSDQGPKEARGVWWMKGNAMPEELYSTMNGIWVDEDHALVVPDGPFSWAWPTQCFTNMPLMGAVCTPERIKGLGWATVNGPQAISFSWGKCPAKKDASKCHDSLGDMSYALMQLHKPNGRLDKTASGISLGGIDFSSTFTMEAPANGDDGNSYDRGCYWGLGGCNPIRVGSYTLVKLVDVDGNRVEPYFSEWVKYSGSTNMFSFAGWNSERDRSNSERSFKKAC